MQATISSSGPGFLVGVWGGMEYTEVALQGTQESQALENSARMLCIFQSSDHNGLFSLKEKCRNHFLPMFKS
ncbi:hypothetical protein ACQP3D_28175, partial [Escherichia coli]